MERVSVWWAWLGLGVIVAALAWISACPNTHETIAPCQGAPVLLSLPGSEQVYCLSEPSGEALSRAAKLSGSCAEDLSKQGRLFAGDALFVFSAGPGCAVTRGTMPAVQRWLFGLRLELNHATQADLEALPGVGPALAERILAARKEAAFQRVEELDRVKGIGPKMLDAIKPFVYVAGEDESAGENP
jgi:competence ComEA-like helix-hairpin-helix protein